MTYRSGYLERIEIGYLTKAAPTEIKKWLRSNWKEPEQGVYADFWRVDDDGRRLLEYLLSRRNDRLIDYSLARYGYTRSAIQTAYDRGDVGTKYAAISNPRGNIGLKQAGEILRAGKLSLLNALLQNKHLTGDFIANLLYRKEAFSDIVDDQFFWILVSLKNNERLRRPYNSLFLDGFDDYEYHQAFHAVWDLAKSVPANEQWASVLWDLFANTLKPPSYDDLDHTLARWKIEEPKDGPLNWYHRSASFYVRSLLGDFLPADDKLLHSGDPALRISFYRRFLPSKYPNWPSFLEGDGAEFVHAAIENLELWRLPEERSRLQRVCWESPDPSHTMDEPNEFRSKEYLLGKLHPSWFADEPDDVTRSALLQIQERLESMEGLLREIGQRAGRRWL